MSYQSKYTGNDIDTGIDKAFTAVQPDNLSTVATTGNYNDLKNKPAIPTLDGYATEQYVATAIGQAITVTLNTPV